MKKSAEYFLNSTTSVLPAKTGIHFFHRVKCLVFDIVLLILCFVMSAEAQNLSKYERPISTPIFFVASQDTFINLNEDSLIAASLSPVDTTIREGKSTTIATLGSMIVPGLGQIYNESYWKAPVVWGLGYYFYSVYKEQDDLYKKAQAQYDTTITVKNPFGSRDLRNVRDFYKRQRNNFGWYVVIVYLLNVVDAYVDAALYNFEVSPNLQGTNQWRVNVRIPLR